MQSSFQTIISGHAPDWALEVASPRELNVMAAPNRPAVAFCNIAFCDKALGYIDSLNYMTDSFKPMDKVQNGRAARFSVGGFKSDPALSHEARRLFEHEAGKGLPDREGRTEMLQTVSRSFAELASTFNRARLRFVMTILNQVSQIDIHEDAGQTYSAGIALREHSTLMFPPGSCPPEARDVNSRSSIDYDASRCQIEQAQHLPLRSLGVWTERFPHAIPPGEDMTRLAFFAFIDNTNTTPARPAQSTRAMRFADWVTNSILK